MKMQNRFNKLIVLLAVVAAVTIAVACVFAETTEKCTNSTEVSYEIEDTNPAIYVAQKNANSVVGVITNVDMWNRSTRKSSSETYSEGSGVVIADHGYIITNYHVISSGDSYQVLMPEGDKVDAELVGYDDSLDLAVLKVGEEDAERLTPAAIGTVQKVYVGSTVIAIGNPGGETLFNTVTSGVISCLARRVDGGNTSRTINYVQHDASISSGNSGGGLFDINGNLIGINTLKMGNSFYSNASYEGLAFAIPVDTAYPIAAEIIEYGKARHLGLGVTYQEVSGPDEATEEDSPAGLYVTSLVAGGPADKAGMKEGDYITDIDGKRVTTYEDVSDILDSHEEGDRIIVTVARYTRVGASQDPKNPGSDDSFNRTSLNVIPVARGNNYDDYYDGYGIEDFLNDFGFGFGFPFGGYYNNQQTPVQYDLEILELEVELAYLD